MRTGEGGGGGGGGGGERGTERVVLKAFSTTIF